MDVPFYTNRAFVNLVFRFDKMNLQVVACKQFSLLPPSHILVWGACFSVVSRHLRSGRLRPSVASCGRSVRAHGRYIPRALVLLIAAEVRIVAGRKVCASWSGFPRAC